LRARPTAGGSFKWLSYIPWRFIDGLNGHRNLVW
jgi:hypothetical protein